MRGKCHKRHNGMGTQYSTYKKLRHVSVTLLSLCSQDTIEAFKIEIVEYNSKLNCRCSLLIWKCYDATIGSRITFQNFKLPKDTATIEALL